MVFSFQAIRCKWINVDIFFNFSSYWSYNVFLPSVSRILTIPCLVQVVRSITWVIFDHFWIEHFEGDVDANM